MANENTYTSVAQRSTLWAAATALKRGRERCLLDRFGATKPVPKNKAQVIKFRRAESFAVSTTPLSEGVTPVTGQQVTYTDVPCTLRQYGQFSILTDVIKDVAEDPVLKDMSELSGEQAADVSEKLLWSMLCGGTSGMFSGGTERANVAGTITINHFRAVERSFRRAKGEKITKMIKSTPCYDTANIDEAYIAFCHTDLIPDIRAITQFIPVEKYANADRLPNEVGRVESFRIIASSNFSAVAVAGASGTTYLSGGEKVSVAAKCDVYPIVCIAREAYGVTPLAGANAVTINKRNPGEVLTEQDPLGQRGFVAWKMWHGSCILNDAWIYRVEVGATAI